MLTCEEIMKDITVAKEAITDLKLDVAVTGLNLLCEVYCLTPFHWQSFYLRIFDGEKYTLQYAKPYIRDFHGLECVSTTFKQVAEAELHPGCKGKIYCGIKKIDKDNATINKLLVDCLPQKDESNMSISLCIDGITTMIINHKKNPSTVLLFRNGEKLITNRYAQKEIDFLNNLYLRIEEII